MASALRSWSSMVPRSPGLMKACPPIATSTRGRPGASVREASRGSRTGGFMRAGIFARGSRADKRAI